MPKPRQFGKTWWGTAWIDAMERIDCNANRLPRGRSYATAGRVNIIEIDTAGKLSAKVKGSRSRPYKVEIRLKNFTDSEQKLVSAIISQNPALVAELTMGRLPESVLSILNDKKVSILPMDWDDITADCSCPDWANPCKHLAAVYYIIANEIDKDPLILFRLRNMDPLTMIEKAGFASPSATTSDVNAEAHNKAPSPFTHYERARTAPRKHAAFKSLGNGDEATTYDLIGQREQRFDIADIGNKRECESVFALLNDKPLFYAAGNFKEMFLRAYKNISDSIEYLEIVENGLCLKKVCFTLLCPSAGHIGLMTNKKKPVKNILTLYDFFVTPHSLVSGKGKFLSSLEFAKPGKGRMLFFPLAEKENLVLSKRRGLTVPFGTVLDLFLSLPYGLPISHTSAHADFLNAVVSVARALAASSSFVPVVRNVTGDADVRRNFYIVYKPLYRSEKLAAAIDHLAAMIPPGFAFCPEELGVLESSAAVDELLTLILTYIVNRYASVKASADDKVARAFFFNEPYKIEKFEEQQTSKAITNWLEWLNLKPASVAPAIEIGMPKMGKENFRLKIKVANKKDPLSPMIDLHEVFDMERAELFSLPIQAVRHEVSRQLTVAGEHVPMLKKLLSYKGKKIASLTPGSLAEFLTKGRHICSLLGINAILPKSLKQIARPQVALAAKTKSGMEKPVSYLNLPDLLDFSWQVSLGDLTVSAEEFRKLAESAEGIVRFNDQYFLIKSEEINAILKKLGEPAPKLSAMETLQASVTGEVSGTIFSPDRTLSQIIDNLVMFKDLPLPSALAAELRSYQHRGFCWLYNNSVNGFGSCLADDMGLGKTVQVIALLLKLKEEGWLEKSAVVVCPTTLIGNWLRECQKFAPSLRVCVYHGLSRDLDAKNHDLTITSYGMLRRDLAKFKKITWGMAVIDEAQNIKNPDTDQTKAVKSLSAKSYIALSGTPVENRLMELWSIFDFINKSYLGKRQDFTARFASPIEKYRDEDRIEKLRKATAPFLLRRLKSDKTIINDLPPKIIKEQYCSLSREQAALYQQVVSGMMREIEENDGIARKGLVFKLMTALKQICNHPVQYAKKGIAEKAHSGKAAKALELLEQAFASGEKTLIFTQYREMGELLVQLISDELQAEPLFFHGGLALGQRDDLVEKFQNEDNFPVMIVSLKAGGTGLNLTAATNVIHYDLWWNPAVEDQATDRAYRIGQRRTVMVHRLLSLGTFEEKINEMMSAKRDLAELTVSAGEASLSELSNEQLKELFTLNEISS